MSQIHKSECAKDLHRLSHKVPYDRSSDESSYWEPHPPICPAEFRHFIAMSSRKLDPPDNKKPQLDQDYCRRCNIKLFKDGNERTADLPKHVKVVKNKLLLIRRLPRDFESFFEENREKVLKSEGRSWTEAWGIGGEDHNRSLSWAPKDSMYHDERSESPLKRIERDRAEAVHDLSEKVSEDAILKYGSSEPTWMELYRDKLFRTYHKIVKKPEGLSMGLQEFSLQENFQWSQSLENEKRPKPDLTYAFPAVDLVDGNKNTRPIASPEYDKSFSLQFLKASDLDCMATDKIKKGHEKPRQHDYMCYPWAVMEAKRDGDPDCKTQTCFLQAVNGAAVALKMRANLYRSANGFVPKKLPPVIAFTCVGPRLTVWLAWRIERLIISEAETRMIRIWTTDIRLIWGVYSTRLIIQNMHLWVNYSLEPEISRQLNTVRKRLQRLVSKPGSSISPARPAIHTKSTKSAYQADEEDSSEDEMTYADRNPRTTRVISFSNAVRNQPLSSTLIRRRSDPVLPSTPDLSDHSDDGGSTTLVDERCDEDSDTSIQTERDALRRNLQQKLTFGNCTDDDQSRRNFGSSGMNRQTSSPRKDAQRRPIGLHRLSSSRSHNGGLEPSHGHVYASHRRNRRNTTLGKVGTPKSRTSYTRMYGTENNSGRLSDESDSEGYVSDQEPPDKYQRRLWAKARRKGQIHRISEILHGSEIIPLACSGPMDPNLNRKYMVDCVRTVVFHPDPSRLNWWFVAKNWDCRFEDCFLEVVRLLNQSLHRYSKERENVVFRDSRRQRNRIRRALKLLRTEGGANEVVRLFAAVLSCFPGKQCLQLLEEFEVTIEKEEWSLLELRCREKTMDRRLRHAVP